MLVGWLVGSVGGNFVPFAEGLQSLRYNSAYNNLVNWLANIQMSVLKQSFIFLLFWISEFRLDGLCWTMSVFVVAVDFSCYMSFSTWMRRGFRFTGEVAALSHVVGCQIPAVVISVNIFGLPIPGTVQSISIR